MLVCPRSALPFCLPFHTFHISIEPIFIGKMEKARIRFIVNPIAGFRRNKTYLLELIRHYYDNLDSELALTTCRGDATRLAREAAAEGYDIVVAIGGDGTVNEVASGLVDTDTALGIIPRGSGNGLARGLGIPIQPAGAIEILRHGSIRTIDAGCAAHRYFFAVTGVGFDARVGLKFNATTWRGPLPYFFIAAREFASYHPETIRLKFDHQELEFMPLLTTVANTRQYGNGAIIAPHAKPDDGLLEICIVEPMHLWQVVAHIPKLFSGHIDRTPIVHYHSATTIEIVKQGPILFHVDGEPEFTEDHLRISVKPQALKVIAPTPSAGESGHSYAN